MEISKSKQELARIISENGGWRNGAEFAWYGNQTKKGWFGISKPRYSPKQKSLQILRSHLAGSFPCRKPNNWHQTILSRAEYFHLYPETEPVGVVVDNKTTYHPTVTEKPTIEQLATDYRNAKDYADRKQQEADAAKADAEAKLADLVTAGKALGLELSVAGVEPGLVITEIEDLLEGDVIELTAGGRYNKTECTMVHITSVGLRAKSADDTENQWWNLDGGQESEWRFIRRP